MSRYKGLPPLPERIQRLDELAANLWWSWQYSSRKVFRDLDYQLWRATAHNPVRMLRLFPPELLPPVITKVDPDADPVMSLMVSSEVNVLSTPVRLSV